ncbi:unnamed protein product, partial [Meganyctiphanes norvegica]
ADLYQLKDFVTTDVLSFVDKLLKGMSDTALFSEVLAAYDQIVAAYPDEYNLILKTFRQINEITLSNVISAINSYLFEKFGMSFSISPGKLTAVAPLPVSAATVRNLYQLITVYAPAYTMDVLAQLAEQTRYVYYNSLDVLDSIYLSLSLNSDLYIQFVKDYIEWLEVAISHIDDDYIEDTIDAIFDIDNIDLIEPYLEAFAETKFGALVLEKLEIFFEFVFENYGDMLEELFDEMLELWFKTFIMFQVYWEFTVELVVETILDDPTFQSIIESISNDPTFQSIIDFIGTLTPSKVQAYLTPLANNLWEYILLTLNDVIIPFVRYHMPRFIVVFIENVGM